MTGKVLFSALIGGYALISTGSGLAQYSTDEERKLRQQRLEDRQQEFELQQQLIEWDAWNAQRRMDDLESRERNRQNEWELQRLLERRW